MVKEIDINNKMKTKLRLKTINTIKLASSSMNPKNNNNNNNNNNNEDNIKDKDLNPTKKESFNRLEERFDIYFNNQEQRRVSKQFNNTENEKMKNSDTIGINNHTFSEREVSLREEEKFRNSLRKIFLFEELNNEIL